ncbi:FAD-dependent oxidoreductase [Saccharopolyspora erythraea]|uniref:FAD-binding domain-containing protein n=1 Tax=Saccharopolyspora erythraea TaxID=1836 RepID=A0ABN1DPA6_SACER|nr:FAD-dependent monooxygenase [Saccharopolyspora erythraea]
MIRAQRLPHPRVVYSQVRLVHGRVPLTLLGNAVHAMSPAAGAGANVASRDAASLTGVADGRPLLTALRDYEREMIGHGFGKVRLSAANVRRRPTARLTGTSSADGSVGNVRPHRP